MMNYETYLWARIQYPLALPPLICAKGTRRLRRRHPLHARVLRACDDSSGAEVLPADFAQRVCVRPTHRVGVCLASNGFRATAL